MALATLCSCATPYQIYPQNPLAEEILYPRPGYDGFLTNQACTAKDPNGTCTAWSLKKYDLADPTFQAEAIKLNITCHAAGKRYKICLNEKNAAGEPMVGFCRISFARHCNIFHCWSDRNVDFLPVAPYQAVLDSAISCYNEDLFPGGP